MYFLLIPIKQMCHRSKFKTVWLPPKSVRVSAAEKGVRERNASCYGNGVGGSVCCSRGCLGVRGAPQCLRDPGSSHLKGKVPSAPGVSAPGWQAGAPPWDPHLAAGILGHALCPRAREMDAGLKALAHHPCHTEAGIPASETRMQAVPFDK